MAADLEQTALLERWLAIPGIPASDSARAAGRDLISRYSEPHRRYHDLRHLTEVLDAVEALAGDGAALGDHSCSLAAVLLAAWFHDAVYDVRPAAHVDGMNELMSENLAEEVLAGLEFRPEIIGEVARLVRLTVKHQPDSDDLSGALLCDADLAILAGDPVRYASYTASVREEYREVPDELFRPARAKILSEFLTTPSIYTTPQGRDLYEERARANVAAEIVELTTVVTR